MLQTSHSKFHIFLKIYFGLGSSVLEICFCDEDSKQNKKHFKKNIADYGTELCNKQSYLQMMRLQRRLYGIYTVYFPIFIISCNCKLISFFAKFLKKPSKGKQLILTLKSSCFNSYKSSLQSHPLRVTLYMFALPFNLGVLCLNFNNHGYEDLLVTISPDIPVDSAEAIISKFIAS